MKKLFSLLLVSFSLFIQCKTTKPIEQNDIIIELEKTNCSGTCPVYKLQIASNGIVILEGIENVDKMGLFKSRLSNEELDSIIRDFDAINFFTLNDSYTSFMMDFPTNYISYSQNGVTKKIKAYDNVPQQLLSLINKLDKLLAELEWKKVK